MKTYLTEHIKTKEWGKRIKANSWSEAESKCPTGYKVTGELIEE